MKTSMQKLVIALALLALPALAQAQFTCTTNDGTITITGYSGGGGAVAIPATINSYPVTAIGDGAFSDQGGVTIVTIGANVTSIGLEAFAACTSLTEITIAAANPAYSSLGGVLFDKTRATLLQFPSGLGGGYTITNSVTSIEDYAFYDCVGLTKVTIPDSVTNIADSAFGYCRSLMSVSVPNSVTSIGVGGFAFCTSLTSTTIGNGVTSIGEQAFYGCTNLASVTIPSSVTSIGDGAFTFCPSLTSAYFLGNAPPDNGYAFYGETATATVYYLPGTTGWGSTFGSVPAVLWNPQANTLRFTRGHFGFNLTGPTNAVIVIEACTTLADPVWLPVSTNTLSSLGTATFSDSQSGGYPIRFYRFRSP